VQPVTSARGANEPENDQEQDGPDRRGDDGGRDAVAEMDVQRGQQPAADEGADDSDAEIGDQTETGAAHDLPGQPARDEADQ
jgi:hypothetical protein